MDVLFNALLKESQFTREMLCAGYTQIRNANIAQKGIYFQAFTSLSTGIERIGKIILLLDYAINNNGCFPDMNYMKEKGHDIEKIYYIVEEIKNKNNFILRYLQELNRDIYLDIIRILSRFGKGERYSNIDLLVNSRSYNDPISEWYDKIDKYIIKNNIKESKIEKIKNQARLTNNLISSFSSVYFINENEKIIDTPYEMWLESNINTLTGTYRQLYVYQIIRYFVEILFSIKRNIGNTLVIPDFWEIFRLFNCEDDFVKSRKVLK